MKRKRLTALLLAAVLLMGLLAGCKDKDGSSASGSGTATGTASNAGVAVRVQQVESSTISNENRVSGKVTAETQTSVMVGATATVTAVYVEVGDSVKTGDRICTLDLASTLASYQAAIISRDSAVQGYNDQAAVFDAQIAQYDDQRKLLQDQRTLLTAQIGTIETQIGTLETQVETVKAQVALAEKNLSDTKALLNIGAASQAEVDQAQMTLDQSNLSLDQANLALDQARVSLEQSQMGLTQNDSDMNQIDLGILSTTAQKNSTLSQLEAGMQSYQSNVDQLASSLENVDAAGNVLAPTDGTIMQLNAVEKGMVSPSTPVAVIDGVDQLKIVVQVSEALIPKIAVGDTVDVSVSAAELEYEGVIRNIDRSANMQTSLYSVTVSVPADAYELLSGMFADVTFRTDTSYDTIVVPSEAILTSGGEQHVFVVEDGTAKNLTVTTGLSGNGVTEVLTGLSAGQSLVTVGQGYLSDGDPVRIVSGET